MKAATFAFSAAVGLALTGCATTETPQADPAARVASIDVRRAPVSSQAMNDIATAYVRLSLEIGTHEDGYIDAYYGPSEIKAAVPPALVTNATRPPAGKGCKSKACETATNPVTVSTSMTPLCLKAA